MFYILFKAVNNNKRKTRFKIFLFPEMKHVNEALAYR